VTWRVVVTLWGWGAFASGCAIWALFVIPATLVLGVFWSGAPVLFEGLTSAFLRVYVRSLPFMQLDVRGRRDRRRDAVVLVANHQSFLDPIVLLGLEPSARGPARGYLFRTPGLGRILRRLGFHPADDGASLGLARLHRDAATLQEGGGSLLFFPEGTRSRTGAVGRFSRGAFRVAYDHALPIQPIVIAGLDRVLPPGAWLAQCSSRARVCVRYLEPVHPPYGDGIRRDVVRALAASVRSRIVDGLAETRAEEGGRLEPAEDDAAY